MVMELLEGFDLGRLLLDRGTLEPRRAADLILQACDAIAEAHALGIVHRDIKPTNLFISQRPDGSDLIKVLDFGISKAVQGGTDIVLTQTQSMLGTPAYMSPEQMRSARTVDPRSDVWSLGCVLYEAVEGHPPFEASNFAELCVMVATEDPAPLMVAPELGVVLMRCLAKNVEDRYQSIAEMAEDLVLLTTDPLGAKHQLARIQRVLHNAGRDSTPIPVPGERRSTAGIQPQRLQTPLPLPAASSSLDPAADTVHDVRKGGSVTRMIAGLLVLFAVGIGAGLYVTRRDDSSDSQPAVTHDATVAEQRPATAPVDAADHRANVDANEVTVERGNSGAGDGSAAPLAQPSAQSPPKKPPPKRPPLPPKKPPPPGAGSGAVVKQPPKKCDPFENPNGCRDN
jgi:serine/threonine-protein kinase